MQPHPIAAVPAHQAVQMAPPLPTWRSKYTRTVKSFGIVQIVFTGVTVIACVVKLICDYWPSPGFGLTPMCGSLTTYLPAGILAILSVTMPMSARKCLIIACMVMSILAACSAGINIAVAGASFPHDYRYPNEAVHMSSDAVILLVSIAELVIAILTSVYCCWMMSELQPFTNTSIQYRYPAVPGYPTVNQPVPMGYSTGVYAPNMQMMVGNPAMMNQAPPQPPNYMPDASTTGDKAEDK